MTFISKGVRLFSADVPDDYEVLDRTNIPMRQFEGVVDPRSWSCCCFIRHQHLLELINDKVHTGQNGNVRKLETRDEGQKNDLTVPKKNDKDKRQETNGFEIEINFDGEHGNGDNNDTSYEICLKCGKTRRKRSSVNNRKYCKTVEILREEVAQLKEQIEESHLREEAYRQEIQRLKKEIARWGGEEVRKIEKIQSNEKRCRCAGSEQILSQTRKQRRR